MTYFKILAIAFIFLVTTIPIHSQVVDKKSITLDGANKVIAASVAEAKVKKMGSNLLLTNSILNFFYLLS